MWKIYLMLFLFVNGHLNSATEIEDIFGTCKGISDKSQLKECLMNMIPKFRDAFAEGRPDNNLVTFEPLRLGDMKFHESGGQVNVDALFTDVKFSGLSDFTLKNIEIFYDEKRVLISVKSPEAKGAGRYLMDGNVLYLPIRGNGTYWFTMTDVSLIIPMILRIEEKDDKRVLQLAIPDLSLHFSGCRIRLNHLFDSDPILGEAMNAVIDESALDIMRELTPQITKHLSEDFEELFNNMFATIDIGNLPGGEFIQE